MTQISHFQHYSQKENHVTNNTMLVMRHFYQVSPRKLASVLSELADEDLPVGLTFEQQIKLEDGVPDALISQPALNIYFETKRGGDLDRSQIERHIASIAKNASTQTGKILFGLTSKPIPASSRDEIIKKAKSQNILFAAITFAQIVGALRSVCEPFEVALREVLDDYEYFLKKEKLMSDGETMTVFACSDSMAENLAWRLYFQPSSRPFTDSKFIGLYADKCIKHLAEVRTIVTGKLEGSEFKVSVEEKGNVSEEEIARINGAIKACSVAPIDYENLLHDEYRYYLFDQIYETAFRKSSKYGIVSKRSFELSEWLAYDNSQTQYSAQAVAETLKDKTFE